MCSVFLNEEERTINIAAEHLQPVTPVRGDKVKVIMGKYTGKLYSYIIIRNTMISVSIESDF